MRTEGLSFAVVLAVLLNAFSITFGIHGGEAARDNVVVVAAAASPRAEAHKVARRSDATENAERGSAGTGSARRSPRAKSPRTTLHFHLPSLPSLQRPLLLFTQFPEQTCRQLSTDVIVQTLTIPNANVFSRSSPAEVTKALGNLYHQTAIWDTYCATYEIISRRMTSADAKAPEQRNLQTGTTITITVYIFGRPFGGTQVVDLLTTSTAVNAIQQALQQQLGITVQIRDINVIEDDNIVEVSVRPLERRLRRLSASSKRSKHTKSAHKDIDDELEAANEEWHDMNIAALHHVVSDQPKPLSSAKVNDDDDKKSLPYLSSLRSDFEILPYVCGSDLSVKANAISIATQTDASPNRLDRLVQMAERWDGYISVAIYGKKDEEDDFQRHIESFWNDHAKDLKDKVIIHLVIDGRQEEEGYDDMHYPHNILRNIAMEHTPTDLVFYNDIDFIPSVDSHAMLLKHLSSMPEDQPSVMIMPAFERKLFEGEVESQIITQDVPFSKANLLSQLDTNFERITPFHENYAYGHGPTDYARWYRAAEPYEVEYDLDYEPYFVVDKKKWDVPLFWEHFTGFGKNKQSWVEELAVAGFRFYVCPDAIIVHIDHSVDDQDER